MSVAVALDFSPRLYDSSTGRFLQTDPHDGIIEAPATIVNKYIYSVNDPINRTDPNGLLSLKGIGLAVGGGLLGGALLGSIGGFVGSLAAVNLSGEFSDSEKVIINTIAIGALAVGAGVATGGLATGALGLASGSVSAALVGGAFGAAAGGLVGGFGFEALGVGSFKQGFTFGAILGFAGGAYGGFNYAESATRAINGGIVPLGFDPITAPSGIGGFLSVTGATLIPVSIIYNVAVCKGSSESVNVFNKFIACKP